MICASCEKEVDGGGGKFYTLTLSGQKFWVCQECLKNPLKCFAETLLEMWTIFPLTPAQRIESIRTMFESGVCLPKGISLMELRQELQRRVNYR